ncbi:hypothetical protein CCR94_06545 [Rhodoblastus sphagnicola]|uniref:Uncharacterized protein n=1 Tax=Rhodoblastus sphagnicola TaxID=333368 RepID=A0A2S6NBW2_9HYPH|nr:hypothetical protein [Rhodoblastus sphagnicola]MBB4198737.1 hypothetical protein [Rhodoblastus sphagnicola]PPQ32084.1 hypothetical protein CCR94_06545 [Rhodoblastus sphagnicola]
MAGTLKIRIGFSASELRRLAASSNEANQSPPLLSLAAASDGTERMAFEYRVSGCSANLFRTSATRAARSAGERKLARSHAPSRIDSSQFDN